MRPKERARIDPAQYLHHMFLLAILQLFCGMEWVQGLEGSVQSPGKSVRKLEKCVEKHIEGV